MYGDQFGEFVWGYRGAKEKTGGYEQATATKTKENIARNW